MYDVLEQVLPGIPGLPEWAQVVLQLGAAGVLMIVVYLFVTNRIATQQALSDVRTDADKRVKEVREDAEKRVSDAKDEIGRLLADRGRLLDLLIQFKYTAQTAIEYLPDADSHSARGTRR